MSPSLCLRIQVALQSKKVTAAAVAAAQQTSTDKQSAEQAVIDLLKQAKSKTQSKIDMCEKRQQQKHQLSLLLGSKDAGGSHVQKGDQPSMQTIKDTMRSNDEQLAACKKLVLAFSCNSRCQSTAAKVLGARASAATGATGPSAGVHCKLQAAAQCYS